MSLAAYGAVLAVLAMARGVELSFILVGLVVALVGLVALRRRLPMRGWLPLIAVSLAYELIRGFEPSLMVLADEGHILAVERMLLGGSVAPTIVQRLVGVSTGANLLAIGALVLYGLHMLLPVAAGLILRARDLRAFHDFMAALVILSVTAFVTYLVLPVAPPWWAASHGYLLGLDGGPALAYLRPGAETAFLNAIGIDGQTAFALTDTTFGSDQVASFPSVHAALPFLVYLFARRLPGRARWVALAYAVAVWFAIVYLGDHYLVDVLGGIAYAGLAYWLISGGLDAIRSTLARVGRAPLRSARGSA